MLNHRLVLVLLLSLLLSGCIASNLAQVIKELGDNPATVCVTVNTVYGTGKALRSNVQQGKVKCDMDGMSVDTTPASTR
jgi:hypothetical protein